mmetsp:Transcript_27412/g.33212  ORF Transcript_27412/g.33212 Transcript_27412/m.33212 type:complete len:150 (+) Transcript_27412:81-530(+)
MASLVSYGACQTACNVAWVTCYTSAGLVAGTITAGAAIPAAAVTCNTIQGTCMATCAAKFLAEGTAETAATGGLMGPVLAVGSAVVWFFFRDELNVVLTAQIVLGRMLVTDSKKLARWCFLVYVFLAFSSTKLNVVWNVDRFGKKTTNE